MEYRRIGIVLLGVCFGGLCIITTNFSISNVPARPVLAQQDPFALEQVEDDPEEPRVEEENPDPDQDPDLNQDLDPPKQILLQTRDLQAEVVNKVNSSHSAIATSVPEDPFDRPLKKFAENSEQKKQTNRITKRFSTPAPLVYTTQPPHPLINSTASPVPNIRTTMVDCSKMFVGADKHPMSVQRARRLSQSNIISSRFLTPKQIYRDTDNCEEFRKRRQYVMDSITQEEEDFPIAYSIVMYYAAGQAERLLRAIYRPQNYYCFHVDFKAGLETELSMQRLASCFDNVFVVPNPTSVNWAFYGVLEAELICMEQLIKYKKWKYFINLTGHEFPLKSNYEIVQILKIYNGANEISNLPMSSFEDRWQFRHIQGKGKTTIEKAPPPHNITIHKGDAHVTLSRKFVEYVLTDSVALDFREWVKDAFCPEEIFFSSLQYNTQLKAPGALSVTNKYFYKVISRHKVWASEGRKKCKSGNYRHIICIYGLDDLPDLAADYKAMFVNKLLDDFEPFTYDCLEELYFNRTKDEYLGRKGFDFNFYLRRPFVLHHF